MTISNQRLRITSRGRLPSLPLDPDDRLAPSICSPEFGVVVLSGLPLVSVSKFSLLIGPSFSFSLTSLFKLSTSVDK